MTAAPIPTMTSSMTSSGCHDHGLKPDVLVVDEDIRER